MTRRKALAAAPLILSAAAKGANDRITYALVGAGGRGRNVHQNFVKLGAECVAICDVYQPNLDKSLEFSPQAKPILDFQDVLAMNVDAVLIATSDQHHAPMMMAALKADKDVYLEKPISLNMQQSQQMVAAAKASNRIVQVGMQRRSMPFLHKARKVVEDGALGDVTHVQAEWNWRMGWRANNVPLDGRLDWKRFLGPAPDRPLEPARFRNWRGYWDYSGGNMTDQGTHLMDVIQWMTGSDAPEAATCVGKRIDFPGFEVPNIFSATFEYPKFLATWTLNYQSGYNFDWSIVFRGTKATMRLDRKGLSLFEENKLTTEPWATPNEPKLITTEADQSGQVPHFENFLACVKTRQQPNCTVEMGAAAVAGPHMANIAYREERRVKRSEFGPKA
jgi:predicted dehydrogenase